MTTTTPDAGALLLTDRQVGELLSISRRLVWALVKRGQLAAPVRVGGRSARWRRADVEASVRALPAASWGAGGAVRRGGAA